MNHPLTPGIDGRRHERGMALVVVLVMAVALFLLGISFLAVSTTDRTISSNEADGSTAFNLAEAGIEHAIAELPNQTIDTLLASGGALLTNQQLGNGTYSVTVSNNIGPDFPTGAFAADPGGANDDTDDLVVVESTGMLGNASRGIRVLVELASTAQFKWAAFGMQQLKASGGGNFTGEVGTNGKMDFSGEAPKVTGNAQAVDTIKDPATYVTGTATEYAPPVAFDPVVCPTPGPPFDVGSWGPAPSGPDVVFDAANGKLKISGSSTTTFTGGTYFFYDFSKSGGGMIDIPAGQNVQIYIYSKVSMSGGGFNNLNNDPATLQFWGCPHTSTAWDVTGPQTSWFTIYAPTHKLKFTGDGDKHGSFIGLAFENTGPGEVIYAPAGGGGGGTFGPAPRTWTELW